MSFFEELTGDKYFFTKYDKFYWNNVKKEPMRPNIIPNELYNEYIPSSFVAVQTQDILINDSYTIDYFLKTSGDTYVVFCLNDESIYHQKTIEIYNIEDNAMKYVDVTYIKVFIDYKN